MVLYSSMAPSSPIVLHHLGRLVCLQALGIQTEFEDTIYLWKTSLGMRTSAIELGSYPSVLANASFGPKVSRETQDTGASGAFSSARGQTIAVKIGG